MTDELPDLDLGLDIDSAAPELADAELGNVLEALLLVVDTPVSAEALAAVTEQPVYRVAAKLRSLAEELNQRDSGIDLREAGGGWRMYSRARFAPYVERLLLDGARSKLTRAALETLAVVAYRQPVTRARVSAVRGVNVDAVMCTLLARGLITEAGTDPDTGATTFATPSCSWSGWGCPRSPICRTSRRCFPTSTLSRTSLNHSMQSHVSSSWVALRRRNSR